MMCSSSFASSHTPVVPPWYLRPSGLGGILILLAALVLYLWTLDDGLQPEELRGGDLITHQYAQVQARPANAPGYPLYTMGGWLWFRLGRALLGPYSNPIAILSSYSTLWALLALGLLYRLLLDVTAGDWAISGLCTTFYAVTYFFWYYATTTEQYTSAVAQTLLMIYLAWRWEDQPHKVRPLLWLAFLVGVGLAHLVTVLAIVPPLLWFVFSRRPDLLRRPRWIARALGLVALPLLSYAYVYVRGAQHPEWRGAGDWQTTWQWFWSFLSTAQGRDELTWSLTPLWTSEFPSLIWRELTWPMLLAGLAGIAALGRRRGRMIYATLAIYLAVCFIDRLGNWYQVIMPVYPLILLGAAALGARWSRTPLARSAFLAALGVLVVYRFALSLPGADSRGRAGDTALDPGWTLIADDPPAGAAILGVQDELLALDYLTVIWGVRPDLRPVGAEEAARLLDQGHLVLSTLQATPIVLQEIDPAARFTAVGVDLVAVRREPERTSPSLPTPARRVTDDGLILLGASLRQPARHPALPTDFAPRPRVVLSWQATAPIAYDWSISLRPTRGGAPILIDGQVVQVDHVHPAQGVYPTSRWLPGEIVRDEYLIPPTPGQLPDGFLVIVYRALPEGGFLNAAEVSLPLPQIDAPSPNKKAPLP